MIASSFRRATVTLLETWRARRYIVVRHWLQFDHVIEEICFWSPPDNRRASSTRNAARLYSNSDQIIWSGISGEIIFFIESPMGPPLFARALGCTGNGGRG